MIRITSLKLPKLAISVPKGSTFYADVYCTNTTGSEQTRDLMVAFGTYDSTTGQFTIAWRYVAEDILIFVGENVQVASFICNAEQEGTWDVMAATGTYDSATDTFTVETSVVKEDELTVSAVAEPTDIKYISEVSYRGRGYQGVTTDGTYLYVFNGYITKLTKDGTFVAEHDCRADPTTYKSAQDGTYHNGMLYRAASNYPDTPRAGSIIRYDATDLSFVDEIVIDTDYYPTGITFHEINGTEYAWVITDKNVIQYDTSFTSGIAYDLEKGRDVYGYQGGFWYGDYLLVNHKADKKTDVYKWNGAGFDLIRRIDAVEHDGWVAHEGMDLDPVEDKIVWMAAHKSGGTPANKIFKCRLLTSGATIIKTTAMKLDMSREIKYTLLGAIAGATIGGISSLW